MVNKTLCDMLGYDVESLCRRTFAEITHPDDLDENLGLFTQSSAGDLDFYRRRTRYLHAHDRIVWGDLSAALVREEDGRPLHLISQILDVTAQHEQEQHLEAASVAVAYEHQGLKRLRDSERGTAPDRQ